jgi:adenylate cyclase
MAGKSSRRFLFPALTGLLLTAFAVTVKVADVPVLTDLDQRLEWLAYDLRLRLFIPDEIELDPRIVIIDIDEKSLRQEGRWPWSRATIAKLTDRVFEHGALILAMDVVYAEEFRSPVEDWLDFVDDETRDALLEKIPLEKLFKSQDQVLAESFIDRDVVMGFTFTNDSGPPKGQLPEPLPFPEAFTEQLIIPEISSYVANIELLQESASGGGFFSIIPDADGVIRRAPMLMQHEGLIYGALALEVSQLYMQTQQLELRTAPIGDYQALESLSLDGFLDIPVDGAGNALIPYRGPAGSFHYISAADVLNGEVPGDLLQSAIALFGTTAVGIYDMRSTPVESVFPGVEVHANLIAGILDGSFPTIPSWALGANVGLLILIGVVSVLLVPFISTLVILLLSLLSMVMVIALNLWLWDTHGVVLSIVAPLVLIALIGTSDLAYGFLTEARGRRQLKAVFGQYVPPEIVDEMNQNPDGNFSVEGESRELSVLFCDIRSFTTISESLAADELKQLLNKFFTPMTRIIFERRGTIDKYVGDMIMAFWGAPVQDPQHRQHAVEAALAMLEQVVAMRPEFSAHNWPEVNIGIGINTGMMNVGDMGSEYRRAYTVIGDAVNLGSRLEGLTKYYGVLLIVSETTAAGLENILLRHLDRVKVKGKNEPVDIYEPVGLADALSDERVAEVAASNAAIQSYFAADWEGARTAFMSLQHAWPERQFYTLYLDRISQLQGQGIQPGWDGVFVHTSK